MIRFILFGITLLIFQFIVLTPAKNVYAQKKVESDHYTIQLPNLNSGAGIPSSTNFILNSTIGQTAQGEISSTNYIVKAGFQYIHSIIPFYFSISDISIDFGTLTPGTPSTQQATLTVSAGGAGGYAVTAFENHPLQNGQSDQIADTLCDSGPCSQTSAQPWTSNTTYGFGFNMSGDDVPADFVNSTYYRQFADASAAESAATIMNKSGVTYDYPNNTWPWRSVATITYKVNVSSVQEAGTYTNFVTFIATPTF